MQTKPTSQNKINIVTLGCSKNLVDSEVMMGQLKGNDFDVVHQNGAEDANIVIVNTCGFIDNAKEESINTILEYVEAKKSGSIEQLYVTGCLSERYRDDLQKEIPEVDAYFGTMELPFLLNTLGADYKHELIGERQLTTAHHFAYVKISEGCNRTCSFCAIPLMRGKHKSRPVEEIVNEAKALAAKGVKEIMLIAQELTYYGLDIYRKRRLADLLYHLSDVEGIEWIRLHYAYPAKFPMDVLKPMQERNNICNYLDIPLQHASNPMLLRMIGIRTTMMVGFPGETDDDFQQLYDFVQDMAFERMGAFTYSHEEGTRAHELSDDVDDEVKQERAAELMELQQQISAEKNAAKVGQTHKVLFDRKEGDYFVGRTEHDSPEVDNEVLVDASANFVRIGDFANVQITGAEEFDLYGEVV
ncbi:MAG: 30S ribosomal protein S12 methylthiotransferase RimO [Bacteroidetes bacterium SW_11_45_7]|nr:MAG: 30S ribosomal protein S12 methylthiotransferase RimO [Bacteroidetes bacterium SW_11_45_7]